MSPFRNLSHRLYIHKIQSARSTSYHEGRKPQKGLSAPEAVQSGQIEGCSVRPRQSMSTQKWVKASLWGKGAVTDRAPYPRAGFLHILAWSPMQGTPTKTYYCRPVRSEFWASGEFRFNKIPYMLKQEIDFKSKNFQVKKNSCGYSHKVHLRSHAGPLWSLSFR